MDSRVVAKFGENRQLGICRKVVIILQFVVYVHYFHNHFDLTTTRYAKRGVQWIAESHL